MFPLKRSSRDKPSRKEERQVSNILRDINLNDGGTETKKWGREREPSHYADINVNYGKFTNPNYMPREVYVNQNSSINLIFVEDAEPEILKKEIRSHISSLLEIVGKKNLADYIELTAPSRNHEVEQEVTINFRKPVYAIESAMLDIFLAKYGKNLLDYTSSFKKRRKRKDRLV